MALRLDTVIFLAHRELPRVVLDASVDGDEVPLIKVNTAVEQLVHFCLNENVHLVFGIVVGIMLITELVDQ